MAFDTKTQRVNVLRIGNGLLASLPEPDASFDSADRHHVLGAYTPQSSAPTLMGGDDSTSLFLSRRMRIGI